jgi:phosphoglucomutase/phosphomannomutase
LDGPYDAETKQQIRSLQEKDPSALLDAFYTRLAFGTGGLRGIMGPGTNRMNSYTVGMATQGLASYILKQTRSGSVLIGFDSRHNSPLFAEIAARVLAGNGIRAFLLKELRPTPYISWGLRHKGCTAGIMITASHNPAEYNGYKAYWSDGGQVVPPHDTGIMQEVERVTRWEHVKLADASDPLIVRIGDEMDADYLAAIRQMRTSPAEDAQSGGALQIVYTSLHGCGITLVPRALAQWGFSSLRLVQEQVVPDGDFPTVKVPNPEYKEALQMGIDLLQSTRSDILIATDPDSDRMAVAAAHHGAAVILTGNEIAALCVHYLCDVLLRRKALPARGAFVTTIVSSDLIKVIAESYGQHCFEVLTGFKYIGQKIHEWERSTDGFQFLFGAEESYGYLLGTHARDKDAVVSACLIAEIALAAKKEGATLIDRLHALYATYGIFQERQLSLSFDPGKKGMEQMQTLMTRLRASPPESLAGQTVISLEDYEKGEKTDRATGAKTALSLPQSDVLLFRLAEGGKVVVRPSGTEPKIKIYAGVRLRSFSSVAEGLSACNSQLDALLQNAQRDLCAP